MSREAGISIAETGFSLKQGIMAVSNVSIGCVANGENSIQQERERGALGGKRE